MKKKVQGRKGRPSIGSKRDFRCSDDDYSLAKIAALLSGVKLSEFIRESVVLRAEDTINKHATELSEIEFEDEELAKIAAKYLK